MLTIFNYRALEMKVTTISKQSINHTLCFGPTQVFDISYYITSWVEAFDREWQRGQEFEATFYDRNPTPVKPYLLDNDVVMDRFRCLKPLVSICRVVGAGVVGAGVGVGEGE